MMNEELNEEITEQEVEEALQGVLEGWLKPSDTVLDGACVSPFSEFGLLTTDKGVVIAMNDGTQFELTIKRSL